LGVFIGMVRQGHHERISLEYKLRRAV